MRKILLRAVVLLASWAMGLLVAAWIVPGVSLSVPGFMVAVVVFAVAQAILSLSILTLPRRYASLVLGGTGLALTIVALILASVLTHGITIDGMASWLATTVVVWLVTTIGAITLPELLIRAGAARPDQIHAGANGCTSVVRVEILHFARIPQWTKFDIPSGDGGSGDGRHA
ncbi:phage holin family protein [Mycobacterium colombiense]|uniref:phage holin family protein n=1 Tax=Mycobacterium colombiense TaxID=339268 RepID=UPI000B08A825